MSHFQKKNLRYVADESPMLKFHTQLLQNSIFPTNEVKNLGVTFDSGNTFANHITKVNCACYYHLKDLMCIRKFLSVETTALLANSMISSQIYYYNFLLYGINKHNVGKLQKIQNALSGIVFRLNRAILNVYSLFSKTTLAPIHTTSCLSIISLHSRPLHSPNIHTDQP